MAYQARKNDPDKQAQEQRNNQNNANNIRNAADVAMATKNPYAMAAGAAVKGADKLTGGKSSEFLGKALTKANKMTPGGKQAQNALNKINESGIGDKVGKAAAMKNGMQGDSPTTPNQNATSGAKAPDINQASRNKLAENQSSEISGLGEKKNGFERFLGGLGDDSSQSFAGGFGGFGGKKRSPSFFESDEAGFDDQEANITTTFKVTIDIKKVLIFTLPVLFVLLIFVSAITAVGGGVADFDDALGASTESGGQTGDIEFVPSSKDAKKFYERINDIKLEYQAEGRTLEPLKIAAVYHIMNINNNKYDYDYMTKRRIREVADAMYSGNSYDEEAFKENLTNNVFVKYFPDYTQAQREALTYDVFDYIERYYSFIGEDPPANCASVGSCSYNIKGFYIPGRGNVVKQMNVSNLQVRLMECGSPYGNGNYNTPINQPMVSFEDYVAGVAYAEIGPSAPIEAIKAQMVIARSYALARPTAMGNSNGKKLAEENGQWVLQISSCVADQVFCNINEGCSYMGGGDGQGGICRSGKVSNAIRTRDALSADHQIRTASSATAGEVLVNNQGYIIEAGYLQTEQTKIINYAKQGMNYKQILLQVYNTSPRAYHASDIEKMSCNTGDSTNCITQSGPYASWKQYQGPWTTVQMGKSGKTIRQIGCLATSISMLIAKSGVPTVISDFNPGTFVEFLSANGGFDGNGNFMWYSVSKVAPKFKYVNKIYVSGQTKQQKLNTITNLLNQGYYVVAEVKGNTGQHWVAIDAVAGETVVMMDPGSSNTDMWAQYNWRNTSALAYFKVEK